MSAFDEPVFDCVEQELAVGDYVAYIGGCYGRKFGPYMQQVTAVESGDVCNVHIQLEGNNRKVMPWNVIKTERQY